VFRRPDARRAEQLAPTGVLGLDRAERNSGNAKSPFDANQTYIDIIAINDYDEVIHTPETHA
jgi:hypothetical protein